jgi:hypothetical protein
MFGWRPEGSGDAWRAAVTWRRQQAADPSRGDVMATKRQKAAARRNIAKARQTQSARAHGADIPRRSEGMSTAEKDRVEDQEFAFPTERKEPLTDARHVRNAIARFDQVEGVSDAERDRAWQRILAAAKRHDVEVSASSWRDLAKGGKDRKR